MLKIERTQQFKRDYRRESKGHHRLTLESALVSVLHSLVNNEPLPDKNRDHVLTGEWKDFRDCHIKPDLILIYRKLDHDVLQLVRLGSHSELGL